MQGDDKDCDRAMPDERWLVALGVPYPVLVGNNGPESSAGYHLRLSAGEHSHGDRRARHYLGRLSRIRCSVACSVAQATGRTHRRNRRQLFLPEDRRLADRFQRGLFRRNSHDDLREQQRSQHPLCRIRHLTHPLAVGPRRQCAVPNRLRAGTGCGERTIGICSNTPEAGPKPVKAYPAVTLGTIPLTPPLRRDSV